MIRRAAVTMLALAACVATETEQCPDGSVCGTGRTCVLVAQTGGYACADRDQRDACNGAAEGDPCTAAGAIGTCFGGGCVPAVCGDGILDAHEVCDDANTVSGDGCAKDCESKELCGNQVIDLLDGEQCDDGNSTLGGDGCTRTCQRELDIWRDVTPHPPDVRWSFSLASDPVRGVVMFGGTGAPPSLGATSQPNPADFNDTWRYDGTTWVPLLSPVTIDRRTQGALASDRHGHILEYGGLGAGTAQPQSGLWEWDGKLWRKRLPVGSTPGARYGVAFACADGAQVACVLFGGQDNSGALSDTWAWDGAAWTLLAPTGKPTPRRNAQMVFDPGTGPGSARYLLFGGESAAGAELNDMWQYAPSSTTWTKLNSGGMTMGLPFPTTTPGMAFDEPNKRAIVIAGMSTWSWDSSNTWTILTSGNLGTQPVLAYDSGAHQVIAIGPNANGDALRMWTLASASNTSWLDGADRRPAGGSHRTPGAYDERRGRLVVADADTWEWDGNGWTHTGATSPAIPTTEGGAMVYAEHCAALVEFGGGPIVADAQRHNVAARYPAPTGVLAWSPISASTPPSARTRHAMTYDTKRHTIVVFGGLTGLGTFASDTWELAANDDCTTGTWTELPASAHPAGRYGASLVYDPLHAVSVLFGGLDENGTALGDTWTWDGTTWTQLAPPPAGTPPARFDPEAAFDPRRGRIVMYGGRAGASERLTDGWTLDLDHHTWVEMVPAFLPTTRSGATFALDITGNLVAVNGEGGGGSNTTSIARLSSELSTAPRETCDQVTDADGDGLMGCADPDCWTRCTPTCAPGEPCAAGPKCGDGACDPIEDWLQCPSDCPAPPL